MDITIPRNDDEARESADLAVLTEWALAGYVASQVTLAEGRGKRLDRANGESPISPVEFAERRIRGLRDPKTVRLYAERWRDSIGAPPKPGAKVTIPDDLGWPPTSTDRVGWGVAEEDRREAIRVQAEADGTGPAKAVDIASNTKAMAAAIKADPKTAEAARVALNAHDEQRRDKAIRDHRGNPDIKADDGGLDKLGIEANRIITSIRVLAADVRSLHRRAELDQWPDLADKISVAVEDLALSAKGVTVPDSLEGVEL